PWRKAKQILALQYLSRRQSEMARGGSAQQKPRKTCRFRRLPGQFARRSDYPQGDSNPLRDSRNIPPANGLAASPPQALAHSLARASAGNLTPNSSSAPRSMSSDSGSAAAFCHSIRSATVAPPSPARPRIGNPQVTSAAPSGSLLLPPLPDLHDVAA